MAGPGARAVFAVSLNDDFPAIGRTARTYGAP